MPISKRKKPTKALLALKPGDGIIVRHDNGAETFEIVKERPWLLGNGLWIVGIAGFSGGYDLTRCRPAPKANDDPYGVLKWSD